MSAPIFSWRKRKKIQAPYSESPNPPRSSGRRGPVQRAEEGEEVDVVADVRPELLLHVHGRRLHQPRVLEPVVGELRGVLELVRRGDLEELERRVRGAELGGGEVVVDDAVRGHGQDVDGVAVRVVARAVAEDAAGTEVVHVDVQLAVDAVVRWTCRPGAAPGSRGRRSPGSRRPPRPRRRAQIQGGTVAGLPSAPSGASDVVSTQWTQRWAPHPTAVTAVGLQPLPVPGGTPPASGRARIRRATARSAPVSCACAGRGRAG